MPQQQDDHPQKEINHYHAAVPDNVGKPILTKRPVLFIAEDNDDLRFYLKDNLLNQYEIYEASNGTDA